MAPGAYPLCGMHTSLTGLATKRAGCFPWPEMTCPSLVPIVYCQETQLRVLESPQDASKAARLWGSLETMPSTFPGAA